MSVKATSLIRSKKFYIFTKCFSLSKRYVYDSQGLVSFASENDLIPWIGFISCEAVFGNEREVVRGGGFHLSVWNTVTARIVSTCLSCRLQTILDSAETILTKVT